MILPPSICTAQVEYVASLLRASLVGETPTKTEPEPTETAPGYNQFC